MTVTHSNMTGDEIHVPNKTGTDTSKSATPAVGAGFNATDTMKGYDCFETNNWVERGQGTAFYQDVDNVSLVRTSTTVVTFTADALHVQGYRLESINNTVDNTASGAGGIDTGSVGASTWYYIYEIYKPSTKTKALMASLSGTSPTMPSLYTARRIVGTARTDGSSQWETGRVFDAFTRHVNFSSNIDIKSLLTADATVRTQSLAAYVPPTAEFIIPYTQIYAGSLALGIYLLDPSIATTLDKQYYKNTAFSSVANTPCSGTGQPVPITSQNLKYYCDTGTLTNALSNVLISGFIQDVTKK